MASETSDRHPAWHVLVARDTLERLASDPRGLSPSEAARRLAQYGPNELEMVARTSAWRTLGAQFQNVLVVILLVATVVSGVLGHTVEAIAITVIVLFAVLLGFLQEHRAERALEALRTLAAPLARVRRDGEEASVPASELVPGDIVLLNAGDRVPADVRLVESARLAIDESALTGESAPVEKSVEQLTDERLALGDRSNMAYAGTVVTAGRGVAVVVATGMSTEFGGISRLVQSIEGGRTPLQENLDRLGATLGKGALVVVALVVAAGLYRGFDTLEMLIFGIALAVAVVPEALPAVVTISLAIGVRRMVRRNALVRRLPVVETLGSTSVICSDKTGTLTQNEMTLRRVYTDGETFELTGVGYEPDGSFLREGVPVEPPPAVVELLGAALLSSDARIALDDGRPAVLGDPTEGALVVAAAKAGIERAALERARPRRQEIPFTSERRRMTTLHVTESGPIAYSKGAVEAVLASCASEWRRGTAVPLSDSDREHVRAIERRLASDGLRVLAVASKPEASLEDAESGMALLGLAALMDPPRSEAADAVATCAAAGIETLMITGDHPLTARAIASEIGLLDGGRVVSGLELDEIDDDALTRVVADIRVYARVSPAHKLRVVEAWQRHGDVVAMTGDGVNDAPALKKADVGIAMGVTGTDVSKEAAAVTLLDDNFASIVAAVEEGRIVFANVKKYIVYLLSSNVGEIVLMAGAVLTGLPLPLTAVQILYVNLATDGLPALALAVDPPELDLMERRPRNPRVGVFTRPIVVLLLTGGLWSAAVNVGLFATLLRVGRPVEHAMAMTFTSLVLIQFLKAYNFRSQHASVFLRPFANLWLNLAILWELVLLAVIIYLPFLHEPFGTYALPLADWALAAGLALTIVPVLEIAKWMVRRGWFGEL